MGNKRMRLQKCKSDENKYSVSPMSKQSRGSAMQDRRCSPSCLLQDRRCSLSCLLVSMALSRDCCIRIIVQPCQLLVIRPWLWLGHLPSITSVEHFCILYQ